MHNNLNQNTDKDYNIQTESKVPTFSFDIEIKSSINFLFNPEFHTKLLYYAIRYNTSSTILLNVSS